MTTRALAPLLLLTLAACGGGHAPPDNAPDVTTDPKVALQGVGCSSLGVDGSGDRGAVFHTLSATSWADAKCSALPEGLAPSCSQLELRADGSYIFRTQSDYTERDDAGRWSFALGGARSGVVCLDGAKATAATSEAQKNLPSALAFTLDGNRLAIGNYGFIAGPAATVLGDPVRVDDVPVPAGYVRLLGEWAKSNTFDLYALPTDVRFDRGGRFFAQHQNGCSYGGSFSWDKGIFTPVSDANTCDTRGGITASIASSNDEPSFVDDLLVFYSSSLRKKAVTGPEVFYFDPYSHDVRVRGELDSALKVGSPTRIALRLDNQQARARTLDSISVKTTDNRVLATRDLTGIVLVPNGSYVDAITITPDSDVGLSFELAFHDDRQPYKGSRLFFGGIAP